MPGRSFTERLKAVQRKKSSVLCVGLDPDLERLPASMSQSADPTEWVVAFNRAIIEATAEHAAAFKLNLAFFEVLGEGGWRALEETLDGVPEDVLTIADGKRGDIGNSARFYARAAFDQLGFDACTVSGYMGEDSVAPFLEYEGRCAFLLARTSNPGAADFQEVQCGDERLFERVVSTAARWDASRPGELGYVAGATDVDALHRIRRAAPEAPLLVPGVGTQGGDARAVMSAAAVGGAPVLVNSSRSIIYASLDSDFAAAAAHSAEKLKSLLQDAMPY